jgi:hypothetical protein
LSGLTGYQDERYAGNNATFKPPVSNTRRWAVCFGAYPIIWQPMRIEWKRANNNGLGCGRYWVAYMGSLNV